MIAKDLASKLLEDPDVEVMIRDDEGDLRIVNFGPVKKVIDKRRVDCAPADCKGKVGFGVLVIGFGDYI